MARRPSSTYPTHRLALLCLGIAALSACAPYQPRFEHHATPAFSEGRYGTWNFVSPMAIEEAGYPPETIAAFKEAVVAGLTGKGYERSSEPELLVNIASDLGREGDSSLTNDPYQTIHPQRGTFYSGWRGYGQGYGSSSPQRRFGEGRIDVGLIGVADQALLWEGVATGRLSGQRTEDAMREMIDNVTRQLLEPLPAARSGG